jgi:hypothetical protein
LVGRRVAAGTPVGGSVGKISMIGVGLRVDAGFTVGSRATVGEPAAQPTSKLMTDIPAINQITSCDPRDLRGFT